MKAPPIVDQLTTRRLEHRQVTRTFVENCTVREADAAHLLLAGALVAASRLDPYANRADPVPPPGAACVRLDVVSEYSDHRKFTVRTSVTYGSGEAQPPP